jgi:hypothetical protein
MQDPRPHSPHLVARLSQPRVDIQHATVVVQPYFTAVSLHTKRAQHRHRPFVLGPELQVDPIQKQRQKIDPAQVPFLPSGELPAQALTNTRC